MVDNSQFDDIPGTTVFTAARSRAGFHLNQFCMSLMKAPARERFRADQRAYLDEWPLSEEQKQAVIDRDFNQLLALGGNVYFLSKIFATDGLSYVQAVSSMTGMSVPDYQAMMLAGGRNIEGWRSKSESAEPAAESADENIQTSSGATDLDGPADPDRQES
jgi:protocatechuate 4,5-dioxygenase alpha chain